MKTFSQFQEGVVALKVGSKLLPKLMVSAGLAGTLMQIKKRIPKDKSKTADIARELGLDLTDSKQRMKANSLVRRNQMKNKKNIMYSKQVSSSHGFECCMSHEREICYIFLIHFTQCTEI